MSENPTEDKKNFSLIPENDFSDPQRFFYRIVFRKSGNKALFVQSGKGAPAIFFVLTSIKLIMLIVLT